MPVNPYNLDMITKICNHLNTACAIITYRHNFHFEYANDLYYHKQTLPGKYPSSPDCYG